MADRYLFAGGDLGIMRYTGGTPTASASSINAAYADNSVAIGTSAIRVYADFIDSAGASDSVVTGETLWLRFDWGSNAGTSNLNYLAALVDGSDQPWLALRSTSTSGTWGLYYNSGTGGSPVWTLIGSTFSGGATARKTIDIKLTLGSPHSAEIYLDGVLQSSGTFTQASLTAIDAVFFASPGNTNQYSQILATVGIVTIGSFVFYGVPSAAGSNAGWTGAYTNIDDTGTSVINDADLISSASAGQRSTFAYANLPTLGSGYSLGDAFLVTRARNNGAAPANVAPVRRSSGGTDNVGSAFSGIGTGFADFVARYTGLTESEYNASEFGVESAT